MKIYEKFRVDVKKQLERLKTPCDTVEIVFALGSKWHLSTDTIADSLRAAGFPVIGKMVYDIDE
jgi:hypothetical protein